MKKYTLTVGLPNVANTCYMNSLLQALSGCTKFTKYMDRLYNNIHIDEENDDEISVYFFVNTIRELKIGSKDASKFADYLHDQLCNSASSSSNGVPFTTLMEQ